ncbi:MAG TPA: PilZ domain-containing protein [Candidatus Acidoferrales bacterium]|nr:PilZ domain-containing protein [Candidatus Acidoferrales bacterium]
MSRIWQALRQAEQERKALAPQEAPDIEEMEREPAAEEDEARPARGLDRRKGLRHTHETPVLVYGSDSEKQPFHEQSETIDANENGCLLSLASSVSRGQRLFLTNMRNQAEQECRVIYVGRRVRGKSRVGVEFIRPTPQFWRGA